VRDWFWIEDFSTGKAVQQVTKVEIFGHNVIFDEHERYQKGDWVLSSHSF